MIPVPTLTTAEVLAELFPVPGEGVTTPELAELWGCSESTARRRVRKLIKDGLLVPTRVQREGMAGRVQPVPAYMLTDEEEKE
jgi:predicted transcriptional regulator